MLRNHFKIPQGYPGRKEKKNNNKRMDELILEGLKRGKEPLTVTFWW